MSEGSGMTEQASSKTVAQFPVARSSPFDPPAEYLAQAVYRARLPSGQDAWIVTRHQDVRAALSDPRLSADLTKPGYPVLRAQAAESPLKGTFMRADGEAHQRVRRMLNDEFTLRRAEAMRPGIGRTVDRLLDRMEQEGPPADLVQALALPVPSIVICGLLGVPYQDREVFQERTLAMIDTKRTPDEVRAASMGIYQYLDQLVGSRLEEPADDLISRLIEAQVRPGLLDRRELVMICLILLAGGHETTANMISLGTLTLLQNPDQLAQLRADPSLVPGAVDELLRHQTIMQIGIYRAALEDVEIGGQRIRAGEGVIALLDAANRDESVFPDAGRLDIRRGARAQLGFSYGPHHCVGRTLARVELEVTFTALLSRFPRLQLAVPLEELRFRPPTIGLYGVEALPIEW
jgi:cytochrome P450